jgi:hypothetical protein
VEKLVKFREDPALISRFLLYLYTKTYPGNDEFLFAARQFRNISDNYEERHGELHLDMFVLADKYCVDELKDKAQTQFLIALIGKSAPETSLFDLKEPRCWWSRKLEDGLEEMVKRIVALGRRVFDMADIPGKSVLVNAVLICIHLLLERGGAKLQALKDFVAENYEMVALSQLDRRSFSCAACGKEEGVYGLGRACAKHERWACYKNACVEAVVVCFHCLEIGEWDCVSEEDDEDEDSSGDSDCA